ncbi:MAG: globin [Saprospiraceae bacterium]|nr:globin [Saprospiraceae bacterium]
MMNTIYERLGDTLLMQLIDEFYKNILANPVTSPLFKTDMEIVKKKQFYFLTQFFGGPLRYVEAYGHPMMRARHMPHHIDEEAAVQWLSCMNQAIDSLPINEDFKAEIFNRFPPVAAHMINQPSL